MPFGPWPGGGGGGGGAAGPQVAAVLSGELVQGEAGAAFTYLANIGNGEAVVPGANAVDPNLFPTSARLIQRLRAVVPEGNASGQAITVKLFKNGAATAQLVTFANGAAAGAEAVDAAHPITFADGDTFDVQVSTAAGPMAVSVPVSVILEGP